MMTQTDLDHEALIEATPSLRVRCRMCDYEVWDGDVVVEPHPACDHSDGFQDGAGNDVSEPVIARWW